MQRQSAGYSQKVRQLGWGHEPQRPFILTHLKVKSSEPFILTHLKVKSSEPFISDGPGPGPGQDQIGPLMTLPEM